MKIGYARVSTQDQNLDLQRDALAQEGCDKIFEDKASGADTERIQLVKMMEQLRVGDIVVVWKLDRLGRNLKHLIELVSDFDRMGVGLKSLKEDINTTTSTGKLVFNIFGALAEFERDIIRERTKAGLEAARARGRVGGRKRSLDDGQVQMLRAMARDKGVSIATICKQFDISRPTYYKYLKK